MVSLGSCKDSELKNADEFKPPEVQFKFPETPESQKSNSKNLVNDLEGLFTSTQKNALEKQVAKLKKATGKKIQILTVPSQENNNSEWSINNGFTESGLIITVNKSLKTVGIGIAEDSKIILSESKREKIISEILIPEFNKDNYYESIEQAIKAIDNPNY
jgi:uncharacterized protein